MRNVRGFIPIVVIAVIIVVAALMVGAAWFYHERSETQRNRICCGEANTNAANVNTTNTLVNEGNANSTTVDTSDWQIVNYVDQEHGFTLSVPKEWGTVKKAALTREDANLVFANEGEQLAGSNFIGFGIRYFNNDETSFSEWVIKHQTPIEKYDAVSNVESEEKVIVSNCPAYKYVMWGRYNQLNQTDIHLYIDKGDKVYSLTFYFNTEQSSQLKGLVDAVINSFQFAAATSLDTSDWQTYTNKELGFSISYPKEIMDSYGACEQGSKKLSDGRSVPSYSLRSAMVPIKIFESGNTVYISTVYYYDLTGETTETVNGENSSYFSGCGKVENTVTLLSDEKNYNELAWKIEVAHVQNEEAVLQAIRNRYGTACTLEEKTASPLQNGVYDLNLYRPGVADTDPQCAVNFPTVLKYYPAKGLVITWNLGQSATFAKSYDPVVVYDQQMVDSFRFL